MSNGMEIRAVENSLCTLLLKDAGCHLILAKVTSHWQSSNPIHQQITRLLRTLSPSLMGMALNRYKETTQIITNSLLSPE